MNLPALALGEDPLLDDELRERAVTAVAHSGANGTDPVEVHALWRGLVEGRYRLVEHFEHDGRRYYVVIDNLVEARDIASLDARERRVAEILGGGQSEKVVAYELGVTPSAVSGLLKTTLVKLGLRSRVELVRLVRAMRVEAAA